MSEANATNWDIAIERVVGFAQKFDRAHLDLACHAAFPQTLTPDLLYQIWLRFVPQAPWTAVARILLSRLCREVGYELYEMDVAVRNVLLTELKEDGRFGKPQLEILADFYSHYLKQQFESEEEQQEDLTQPQYWIALASTKSNQLSRKLAKAIESRLKQKNWKELFRLASFIEGVPEALVEFEAPLITYARGMLSFTTGDLRGAAEEFSKLQRQERQVEIVGVNLSIPDDIELTDEVNFEKLVQTVREKIGAYIEERCSTMRVLDMTQLIGLDNIYTNVNILDKITASIRVTSIEELIKNVSADDFDRFSLGRVSEERVPGLEAVAKYSKLMILGKPGAGKTTFLKHLALLCIRGKFQENRIPLFITLKDFAEAPKQPNLLTYLNQIFLKYNITTNTDTGINLIEELSKQGKLLVLLDGLDEVRETDSARVLKLIQDFTNDYPVNQFVITCRIAAREYIFEQFTEVEIADFNDEQIKSFSQQWFTAKNGTVKATKFIEQLEQNKQIREIAANPLLLTLLCLVFEESAEFPRNRSELYKEGLDVLLKKWDVKRSIERDQIYKKLSLKRKEDLLSQVAYSTFERGQYFFKRIEIERHIFDYIHNLPDSSDDSEVLQLDSEAVLKSIEAQHGLFVERARGIYSFSYLTFHEYFTAREISINADNRNGKVLLDLCTHITEKRWREVFLLTVGMLKSADLLLQLMKQQIDSLLFSDEKLQQYLAWVEEKSNSVRAPYKKAAVRAYYFALAFARDQDLTLTLDKDLTLDRDQDLTLDRDLVLTLDRDPNLSQGLDLAQIRDLALEDELNRKLQQLKTELPNQGEDYGIFQQWWKENGTYWTEQLRATMIEHRNIGHDWQFTDSQTKLLEEYYDANKFLVECLNSDSYVSRDVRKYIEDTLLLPIKSIPLT